MNGLRRSDRPDRELLEKTQLAELAARSFLSAGRVRPEPDDLYRTAYERDRDRIMHSNAIRRLAHKTQVFISPDHDHYVTRFTHTILVSQVGRSLAAALGLNEALTEAICLGHDLGHSPFGHTGEEALDSIVDGGWVHSAHSVKVVSEIEPLNLCWETLDGIRAHSWKINPPPATQEGWLCRYADRIAYLSHDMGDAIRAGIVCYDDLPVRVRRVLGERTSRWVDTMIKAVVEGSLQAGTVTMEDRTAEAFHELRDFMFERVYHHPDAHPQREFAKRVVTDLVCYYLDSPTVF